MANPQMASAIQMSSAIQMASAIQNETAEVKQPLQHQNIDESLSEWELARMTSKTWSMEQE